ncbi:MAG: Glu/Leu/Phe/Val dehydrogenase [Actinobacteria bacterium]|nr:Glu/Leu/Phe/Val dehydrogenase [Actinomycetota bacterium]
MPDDNDVGGRTATAPATGDVFGHAGTEGFEQVVFCSHPPSGLRAIIAIHSTALGPALGGTRFHPYRSEAEAVTDVCRLARGMTYKHAVSGLDCGGGKAVILGDPATLRSEALVRAYGRFVDGLAGRYLTAEDVGTTQADMDLIRRETPHVTGVSESLGGSGDPSPATAWGLLHAMRTVAEQVWGSASLEGRHVVVSGVGKVGRVLCDHLAEAGARLTVADVVPAAAKAAAAAVGAQIVEPDEAAQVECDIFAPCALGAVLSERTVPKLRCAAVCGSANNQLATPADGRRLAEMGVLYAPDYVVNAGGVINIAEERSGTGYDHDRAWARIAAIAGNLRRVLDVAARDGIPPADAADRVAEERIASMASVRRIRTSNRETGH